MSQADFLKRYAENILGRALTKSESEKVCAENMNRRAVRDLCAVFAQKKSKKSKVVIPEPIDESMDETIKAVVNDEV